MDSVDFSLTEKSEEPPLLMPPAKVSFVPKLELKIVSEPINLVLPGPEEVKAEPVLVIPESIASKPLVPPKEQKPKKTKKTAKENPTNRAPLWEPTEEQYQIIRDLAELGWPSPKICEALGITPQQFAGAITRYPRLKREYEQGILACSNYAERRLSWRPTRTDLERVRMLAETGLREVEIAAKLEVSRDSFMRRMTDTPQLREAYEQGEGEFRAKLMEQSQQLLKDGDSSLKFTSSLLIHKLKTQCDLTDKKEKAITVSHQGTVEHTHKLNVPKPVKAVDLAKFAEEEMQRAKQISAEKIKPITEEIIEAEVVDDGDN